MQLSVDQALIKGVAAYNAGKIMEAARLIVGS